MFDVAEARADLRQQQEYWARGIAPISSDGLAAALSFATERRASFERDGDLVRDGWFQYSYATERERWELTDAIIERVNPGPFEDPRILAMLARQAASVEFVLGAADSQLSQLHWPCDRVLLGTTGEPRSHAYSARVDDAVVVAVSAGMIDCLYQFAKATVLSWKRVDAPAGSLVAFSTDLSEIIAQLEANPYPVELLFDTLTMWLYEGIPRVLNAKPPPNELHGALQLVINGAERFVLAHEYVHAFVDHLAQEIQPSPDAADTPWERELRADAIAFVIMADGALMLDRLPTNLALQGAMLAMKALEVIDAALSIATTGTVAPANAQSTHPPFAQRTAALEQAYIASQADPLQANTDLNAMQFPAQVGDVLFRRAQPRLEALFRSGTPVHPIWSMRQRH